MFFRLLIFCVGIFPWFLQEAVSGKEPPSELRRVVSRFCVDCHQQDSAEAGVDLETLSQRNDFAADFKWWRRVAEQVEQQLMPPETADLQPTGEQRVQLVAEIRRQMAAAEKRHDGEPGHVVLRRLTRAEYGYAIRDLTGVELDVERSLVADAVGGAGFTNTGIVQFTEDAVLERYLEVARQVADHAVVGSGPLQFFEDPGATGFELSAINRILRIYRTHGFRTSAGEGGEPFGIGKYRQAFVVAWRFHHRDRLGRPEARLTQLADEAGIEPRFAAYIHNILTSGPQTFPTSEIVAAWRRLPVPEREDAGANERIVAECEAVAELLRRWQVRFGVNPDAKEEAPILRADRFDVQLVQPFEMNINWPKGTKAAHLVITIESANGDGAPKAAIRWENPRIQFRDYARRLAEPAPLRDFLSDGTVERLDFGGSWFGGHLAATDLGTLGTTPVEFELPIPEGARSGRLLVNAVLDVERGDDCIVRCTIAQREETDQGKSVSGLLGNPASPEFARWKQGVLEFAQLLPQMSQREPAPSDRDPVPPPVDGTYNNAERNFFHTRIKYFRDDDFLVRNILDDETRRRLDQAWADLKGSFDFHDTWLQFLARKYGIDLGDRRIGTVTDQWIEGLPAEARSFIAALKTDFDRTRSMLIAAEPGHVQDVLQFAARAWRRPLSVPEQNRLVEFYESLRTASGLDHRAAICAVIARVLVSPGFLYRSERAFPADELPPRAAVAGRDDQDAAGAGPGDSIPLSAWELASRLSFLIWASVPDEELHRAAAAGELATDSQLRHQVRRMLRDGRSRRLAAEFFGQWFGFYRFHEFRGIDESLFAGFTPALRASMHEEALAFFDFIVKENRPVEEILFADYTFLDAQLAAYYGVNVRFDDAGQMRRVDRAGRFHRGGLLKLGAVLATTSAPRRTSPVKRGDWIMRRVLGATIPPPPADAGSIAADEVAGDGLSIRERLTAHRRDASCHNCHARFDAFGFALENYDPVGRWRTQYRDEKPVETSGDLRDGRSITGVEGLHDFLRDELSRFYRTLAVRLLGYALGRQEEVGDQLLIADMQRHMQNGGGMAGLLERIVTSRQFRYRQTPAPH